MSTADAEQLIWRAAAAAGNGRALGGRPRPGPLSEARPTPPPKSPEHPLVAATLTAVALVIVIVLIGQAASIGEVVDRPQGPGVGDSAAPSVTETVDLHLENPMDVPTALRLAPTTIGGSLCGPEALPEPSPRSPSVTADRASEPIPFCDLAAPPTAGPRGLGQVVAAGVPAGGSVQVSLTVSPSLREASSPAWRDSDLLVVRWVDPFSGDVLALEDIRLEPQGASTEALGDGHVSGI